MSSNGYDMDTECPACGHTTSTVRYASAQRRLAIGRFVIQQAKPEHLVHRCSNCQRVYRQATKADGGQVLWQQ